MSDTDGDAPRFAPGGMELVYLQIANDLARRIAAGEWRHGDRLPTRADLAEEYGAAQMTIRRAQRELTERGIVRVVHGKGAFVDLGGTHVSHDEP